MTAVFVCLLVCFVCFTQTCFFQRAVMRRIATALRLGTAASMWRVCSTAGTQSWKQQNKCSADGTRQFSTCWIKCCDKPCESQGSAGSWALSETDLGPSPETVWRAGRGWGRGPETHRDQDTTQSLHTPVWYSFDFLFTMYTVLRERKLPLTNLYYFYCTYF